MSTHEHDSDDFQDAASFDAKASAASAAVAAESGVTGEEADDGKFKGKLRQRKQKGKKATQATEKAAQELAKGADAEEEDSKNTTPTPSSPSLLATPAVSRQPSSPHIDHSTDDQWYEHPAPSSSPPTTFFSPSSPSAVTASEEPSPSRHSKSSSTYSGNSSEADDALSALSLDVDPETPTSVNGVLATASDQSEAAKKSNRENGSWRESDLSEVSLKEEKRRTAALGYKKRNGSIPEEGGEDHDFLLQRLEAQNVALASDSKAKRASVHGNSQIKASFDRVRGQGQARGEGMGDADGEGIDWDFWGAVMSDYEEVASTQPRELSRAIQKGIPPALRGMTWQLMAASKDQDLENIYSDLLKLTSTHEKNIRRDLGRTFPRHEYFAEKGGVGQENLFNVVKAYSLYDEEVGYTQGLQFIVGPLLLNMPDEEAFCVLVRLMKSYDLRSHYTPGMPGLQLRLFQFDRLLEELLPGLYMHMLRQGVKSSMYASQWFLTLFGYRFPLELVGSVFDLVFAEGVEAIFRFSVAILRKNEEKLCAMEFEQLLECLKNGLFLSYAPDEDPHRKDPPYKSQEFVREALQIKITPLMLDQFGEEWENICRVQNAHNTELEALRRANNQLSSQVRSLEASLHQINVEHCDLVRQVVMSKVEREELEDELVKYKIAFADLAHQQAFDGAQSYRVSNQSSRADSQDSRERQERLRQGSV